MRKTLTNVLVGLSLIATAAIPSTAQQPPTWEEHWVDFSATTYRDQLPPQQQTNYEKTHLFLRGVETIPAGKKIYKIAFDRAMDKLGYIHIDQGFRVFLSGRYQDVAPNDPSSHWASALNSRTTGMNTNEVYTTKNDESLKKWIAFYKFVNDRNSEIAISGKIRDISIQINPSFVYNSDKKGVDVDFILTDDVWGIGQWLQPYKGQIDARIDPRFYSFGNFENEFIAQLAKQVKREINIEQGNNKSIEERVAETATIIHQMNTDMVNAQKAVLAAFNATPNSKEIKKDLGTAWNQMSFSDFVTKKTEVGLNSDLETNRKLYKEDEFISTIYSRLVKFKNGIATGANDAERTLYRWQQSLQIGVIELPHGQFVRIKSAKDKKVVTDHIAAQSFEVDVLKRWVKIESDAIGKLEPLLD